MDSKAIQEILRLINKSDLAEVQIEEQDFKLHVKRYPDAPAQIIQAAPAPVPQQALPAAPAPVAPVAPAAEAPAEAEAAPAPAANVVTMNSPMIGTFYRKPGPDKPEFAKVGDTISKGQILCIVEAMKLFNEIESDFEGKIVKILVEDATPVEYDQPLFEIELS